MIVIGVAVYHRHTMPTAFFMPDRGKMTMIATTAYPPPQTPMGIRTVVTATLYIVMGKWVVVIAIVQPCSNSITVDKGDTR